MYQNPTVLPNMKCQPLPPYYFSFSRPSYWILIELLKKKKKKKLKANKLYSVMKKVKNKLVNQMLMKGDRKIQSFS